MRILLVEDDLKAARLLVAGLQEENWQVDHCASAEEAEQQIPQGYDLLILDWNLPGMDGMLLCSKLRSAGVSTPALMLTARDALG
jgi:DNA-binding response OmpR family regulator